MPIFFDNFLSKSVETCQDQPNIVTKLSNCLVVHRTVAPLTYNANVDEFYWISHKLHGAVACPVFTWREPSGKQ